MTCYFILFFLIDYYYHYYFVKKTKNNNKMALDSHRANSELPVWVCLVGPLECKLCTRVAAHLEKNKVAQVSSQCTFTVD